MSSSVLFTKICPRRVIGREGEGKKGVIARSAHQTWSTQSYHVSQRFTKRNERSLTIFCLRTGPHGEVIPPLQELQSEMRGGKFSTLLHAPAQMTPLQKKKPRTTWHFISFPLFFVTRDEICGNSSLCPPDELLLNASTRVPVITLHLVRGRHNAIGAP